MRNDSALKTDAMHLLIKNFGEVEAERFIFLVKEEKFDYTEWQRNLWHDLTLEEIYALAKKRENETVNSNL